MRYTADNFYADHPEYQDVPRGIVEMTIGMAYEAIDEIALRLDEWYRILVNEVSSGECPELLEPCFDWRKEGF